MTPYAVCLGPRLKSLPPSLRRLYEAHGTFSGTITVETPNNRGLRAMARIAGFPPGGMFPLTLTKSRTDKGEHWTRQIGAKTMQSQQWAEGDKLAEKLGPITAVCRLQTTSDSLQLILVRWRFLGLPLPRALAPRLQTKERSDTQGRYTFDIKIALPLIGAQLIRYHGHLDVASAALPD